MKKSVSSLALLAVVLSIIFIQVESTTAATSFTLPNPLFELMKYPVTDTYVEIWVGGFGPNSPSDVNQSSLLINGNIVPASVEIAEHALFEGYALKISVLTTDFLIPYGLFWDTGNKDYTVEGEFNDETPFLVESSFGYIGHISGDANSDGQVTVEDMTFLINAIFRGGPMPAFAPSADADGNCTGPNIGDLTYLINSIYRGGPNPTHCAN